MHGLRHANAAIMILLNVVDQYAMARNGWTSDYTFKQIYGYVFPDGAQETDQIINAFLEEKLKLHTDLHTENSGDGCGVFSYSLNGLRIPKTKILIPR